MERNSCARASSASVVPGSVIATKSRAGAISDIAAWKAFGSVVDPDFELTRNSVRCSCAHDRNPRTTSGWVESRMRSSRPVADAAPPPSSPPAQPNTRLNSSGARLEPPIPSTAARRYPSSRMSRARCSSSGMRADIASGRSSHPSHAATSAGALPEAAHSEPSLAQSRSATRSSVHAWRRAAMAPSRALMSGPSCGGQLLPLRLDRLDQLVEALREARHALVDELAGHAFHRDSLRLDRADRLARSVQVAVERALDGAVVEECGDGLDR